MSRLYPIFNIIKLTPAPEDPAQGRHVPPPLLPEIIDGEEEWVVEEILDSRMINWKLRYLVKWDGLLNTGIAKGGQRERKGSQNNSQTTL